MTRKRCVKLLMSYGCSRNEANKKADDFRRCSRIWASSPYRLLCECEKQLAVPAIDAKKTLIEIAGKTCNRFENVAEAFDHAADSLKKWYNEIMSVIHEYEAV